MPSDHPPRQPFPANRTRPSNFQDSHDEQSTAIGRFDTQLEEYRRSFSILRDDVQALKVLFSGMERDIAGSSSSFKSELASLAAQLRSDGIAATEAVRVLDQRFQESRKPNYSLIAIVCTALPALIGAGVFVVASNVANAVAPLQLQIATVHQSTATHDRQIDELRASANVQDKETSASKQLVSNNATRLNSLEESERRTADLVLRSQEADSNSHTDRTQLNDRVKVLEVNTAAEQAERREQNASVRSNLVEVETQFKSHTQVIAMIWEKLFGSRFPTDIARETPAR